jgi:tRNA A-37 threonylcarbamoyl transferase component Bud32
MYETMMRRARLFPPMIYSVLNFLHEDVKNKNVKSVMYGYFEALRELEEEGAVTFSDEYVKISKKFVEKVESKKIRFINLFKTAQRALFTSLLGTFSKTLSFLSQSKGTFLNFQRNAGENSKFIHQLEDPLRYLYIPTARGLVPLSRKMDIEAFAKKVLSRGEEAEIKIEEIGGVLNDVYLIRAFVNSDERKVVVKRFKDWSSFKWFPLNLWALGTKTFAVLGRLRLERECAINQQLYTMGFDVPKILYVSHGERLIFMEYVEGEKLDGVIKRIVKPQKDEDLKTDLGVINRVGEKLARVHALGISLGDTKPENIMVREKNGEICLLDLEQASRNGDKVWDIAEFLYYAGHYLPPFVRTRPAELITKAFIEGYLRAGGDVKLIKKVGNPKYTKVFSIFTLPRIILAISNICRKAGKLKE